MRYVIVLAVVLFLTGTTAVAQWTDPIPLPSDSATDSRPVSIGVADSNLVAAWFSRFPSLDCQIRGTIYENGEWGGMIEFSDSSDHIGAGPAIGMDPGLQRVWIPWYYGSYPVDDDTWGVYAAYGDSSGLFPGVKLFADTGVFDMAMSYNSAFRTGMLYSKVEGAGVESYISIFYRYRDGDTWTAPERIAAGSGGPMLIDYIQPCLAGDTGDVFYMGYTRLTRAEPPAQRVFVRQYPDDVVIGEFNGHYPAIVHDWHGRLVFACVDDSLDCLVARVYDGVWSDPVMLDATPLAASPPTLCIDTLGYFWIAYASGTAPNSKVYARYFDRTTWSAPELVSDTGSPRSPFVVKTWSNRVWVLWATDTGIFSAYRMYTPGIESRTRSQRIDVALDVFPTVSGYGFVISCAPAGGEKQTVLIHNAAGQLVRSFPALGVGRSASCVAWDGTDDAGNRLPNGIYHVRLSGPGSQSARRVILLH